MNEELQPGDILRDEFPADLDNHLPLYMGNGRCGACVDPFGLLNEQHNGIPLRHVDHVHAGALVPLARLAFAELPEDAPRNYLQELRVVHGYAHTELQWPILALTVVSYFHPTKLDLCAWHISYEVSGKGAMPDLLLQGITEPTTPDGQPLPGSLQLVDDGHTLWQGRVTAATADSLLALRVVPSVGKAELVAEPGGVRVRFRGREGRCLVLVGSGAFARRDEIVSAMKAVGDPADLLDEALAGWLTRWGETEIDVPDDNVQGLYDRSHYYLLSSFAPEARAQQFTGWAGDGRALTHEEFTQIRPALAQLGHAELLQNWPASVVAADRSNAVQPLLEAARAGQPEPFSAALSALQESESLDANWEQLFGHEQAFDLVSHGLFIEAINIALVYETPAGLKYAGAIPPEWDPVSVSQLHLPSGKRVSGEKNGGAWKWSPQE